MPSYEDRQSELNPHRDADRARATEVAYAQLRQRGIEVGDADSSDDLATLLSAVERFEEAVSSVGGDRMVHSLDTDEHEDESLVLPRRRGDETVGDYARRVYDAAERVLERKRDA
jgi:hypothetical protein